MSIGSLSQKGLSKQELDPARPKRSRELSEDMTNTDDNLVNLNPVASSNPAVYERAHHDIKFRTVILCPVAYPAAAGWPGKSPISC